jgi:hypothetical protein
MEAFHEWFAFTVSQNSPLAANRLANEEPFSVAGEKCGGMELNKF